MKIVFAILFLVFIQAANIYVIKLSVLDNEIALTVYLNSGPEKTVFFCDLNSVPVYMYTSLTMYPSNLQYV